MAQIRSFEKENRNVRPHTTSADCRYQVILRNDGQKLLSLATFGSDSRQQQGTVSQSMQFDESMARQLANAIAEAFPGISR